MYSFQLRYSEILGDPSQSQEALDASVDGLRKGLLTSILELGSVALWVCERTSAGGKSSSIVVLIAFRA